MTPVLRTLCRVARAVPPALLACAATVSAADPLDADFLAAKAAFERGSRATLDRLAPKLSGYVLEPYVAYWRLSPRIDAATREEVDAFLAKWPDGPLAAKLRVDYLKALGKRGDWADFAALFPALGGSGDTELQCYAIQERRVREGDAALAAAKPLWFTGQSTPDACEPLFAALIANGDLSTADRIARFRLAAEAGSVRLALTIGTDLPGEAKVDARQFAQTEREPARALAKGEFAWKKQGGRELALYALERAARGDAAGVRAAWERQRDRLPEAERLRGNARIALHAARQLHPKANDWFREAGTTTLSDADLAWRVRAALRASAWPDVLAAVNAMSPSQAEEPAWRYWKARALAAAGRDAEANALYQALAGEFHFYGLLAAETLGRRAEPPSRPLTPAPEELAAFGAQPGVRRALKLAELDMRVDCAREWIHVVRGRDDEGLLLAADYALRAGLYDRAINTAERTTMRHDFGLRYLMPFREHFEAAARDQSADEALLFGIARQESRFVPDVVSSAGAVGLMQLMPATARWVAKQLGRGDYRRDRIADPSLNTQFGAYYFRYWQDRLEGMPALAAAAYNAGPYRAQAWRNGAPLEGAAWVESIPFNETRDYVKKVLANAMFYAQALGQPYVALTDRLGTVTPRENGDAAPAAKAP
jgi:soluble lytic murein transglycosylase